MRRSVTVMVMGALLVLAGPAARAHAEFTGLVRLTPATSTNSSATKTLTATCPAGTRVISAGGDTTPGNGRVILDVVRPDPTLTKVTLHASEDAAGTGADWYLQAFVICAPPPASLQLVKATSPVDSAAKSAVATCPSGTRLLGGGAETTGGAGRVLLTGIRRATSTSMSAGAREDSTGTTATWSVTAYAICSVPVTELQTVSAGSPLDSEPNKVATATCPTGLSVVGTFGTITSSAGHVVLDAIFPNAALTSANISAFEDAAGTTKDWRVTAYAVCAASATLVSNTLERGTYSSIQQGATCPDGTVAIGAGADISGGLGRVALLGMQVGSPSPVAGAITHDPGLVDSWTLTTQGVCSSPFPDPEYRAASSLNDSSQQKIVTTSCSSGRKLLGVSAYINGSHVLLEAAQPDPTLTSATAIAIEDEDGTAGNWTLTVYAVCAKPPPGLQLVKAETPLGNSDFAQATATCPAGKHVIGTGHRIFYDPAEVLLDQVGIDPKLSKVTMTVFEDHDGAAGPWQADVYGICINR